MAELLAAKKRELDEIKKLQVELELAQVKAQLEAQKREFAAFQAQQQLQQTLPLPTAVAAPATVSAPATVAAPALMPVAVAPPAGPEVCFKTYSLSFFFYVGSFHAVSFDGIKYDCVCL